MLWILISIAVIAFGYLTLIRPYTYWSGKGVEQGNAAFMIKNFWDVARKKYSFPELLQQIYNVGPNTRYCGMYQMFKPFLMIRDPDLIKQITVKDFDHFPNHRTFIPEGSDPLWSKNLFALTNQNWRDMRTTLSPAFTSSKMKYMFSLISESGEQFVQHFLKQKQEIITVEMKDTFTRYTNDVIANTALGVKCDSLGEPNNELYLMGKQLMKFDFWTTLKFIIFLMFPRMCKIYKLTFFSKKSGEFFTKVVKANIASREQTGIVRPDMIHLLMEARKNGLEHEESTAQDAGFATVEESEITKTSTITKPQITDEDITAQALLFFFGGFDSVSALMCFMSYELALNPDIQERLVQEIDETLENCNDKLTYEALLSMKYMDMVVSETLRKWPSGVASDRVCTKPYTIEPKTPNEKPLHLEKNSIIWLPIYALHRDPDNFRDPERFDPERFSDENKANIKPYTYLPFGAGPRNCIGSRFALLETKTLFFHILLHFEIVPVEKTQIPMSLDKVAFNLLAENGTWLGLKRRIKLI